MPDRRDERGGLPAHEYLALAVDELRGAGSEVDAEVPSHISPARSQVVNYYGSLTVDYERELAERAGTPAAADRGRGRARSRAVVAGWCPG
ncbi:hypothetical protein ABZ934_24355 [Streptomyces sp. NPDC046557]|uniref:hypothetical protein n=1 Tax=Streptomyces sp. NPDC046557 TaxID=3155372 RepID=UPI0033C20273